MSVNNDKIGDEMIERVMQYCDGMLAPEDTARMRAEIAADPALQALAADLTRGASRAREALSGIINDPVPLQLARTIVAAPEPGNLPWFSRSSLPRQAAAIVIGLLIGGTAMGLWSSEKNADHGLRLAGINSDSESYSPAFKATLADLLGTPGALRSQSYALEDSAAGNQAAITMVAWFKLTDGSTCAEFRQDFPAAAPGSGVACQRPNGAWDVMMRSPQ